MPHHHNTFKLVIKDQQLVVQPIIYQYYTYLLILIYSWPERAWHTVKTGNLVLTLKLTVNKEGACHSEPLLYVYTYILFIVISPDLRRHRLSETA